MVVYFNCTNLTSTKFGQLSLARSITALVLLFFVFLTFLYIACTYKTSLKSLQQRIFFCLIISTVFYLAVLSGHIEHYFNFISPTDALCKAVGFLDQYSGSVQLLYSLEIVLVLIYTIRKLCRTGITDKNPKHRCFLEALIFSVPWILPLPFAFIPFLPGAVPYGETGPWCWIQSLNEDCSTNRRGHWEKMGIWYIPFGVVAFISMVCVVLLLGFLFLRLRKQNQKGFNQVIGEVVILIVFLFTYFCLFATEVGCHTKAVGEDEYTVWMIYAILTPLSAVIIPFAFLLILRYKPNYDKTTLIQQNQEPNSQEGSITLSEFETTFEHYLTTSGTSESQFY